MFEEVGYPHTAHGDKGVLPTVLHPHINLLIILLRNILTIVEKLSEFAPRLTR